MTARATASPPAAGCTFRLLTTLSSNDNSDSVYLRYVNTQAPLTARYTAGSASGIFWTEWFTPGAAGAEAVLENIGSCSQQEECNDLYCRPGACVCGVSRPKPQVGAVLSAYEYRRFQPGASPLWTPLRFPGQYHDTESGLLENWHRYYDPDTGGYLQPEPVLHVPPFIVGRALGGMSHSAYAYASNNPVSRYDDNGLWDMGVATQTAVKTGVRAAGAALSAVLGVLWPTELADGTCGPDGSRCHSPEPTLSVTPVPQPPVTPGLSPDPSPLPEPAPMCGGSGRRSTYSRCLDACAASRLSGYPQAWYDFCRFIRDPVIAESCWRHTKTTLVECENWCAGFFGR